MELTARIHHEDGSYWAQVVELPGCFATGDTFDELVESLREGIALYLNADDELDVAELKIATSAILSPA
jgi:predicted RNase H-like HicB family nuclease